MPPSRRTRLNELDNALLALRRLWQQPEVRRFMAARLDRETNLEDYRVLRAIERSCAPVSVGEIASRLGVDASTSSRLIDRLARRKFVVRQTADDRRRTALVLSSLGTSALRSLEQARVDCLGEMTAAWPVTDIADLARLLSLLDDASGSFSPAIDDVLPVPDTPRVRRDGRGYDH